MRRWPVVVGVVSALLPLAPHARATDAGQPWSGEPTWIGGTARYDRGEWIYQDFVYDDGFRADNAADIVHVRLRERGPDLHIRVTMNSLLDSSSTVLGVALSSSGDPGRAWPLGAGVQSRWETFTTVVGQRVLQSTGDDPPRDVGAAAVDLDENTIELVLPRPASSAVSLNIGAGEWDASAAAWTADGVVDLAFNTQDKETVPAFLSLPVGIGTFRADHQQKAINGGVVSYFDHPVDLAALRTRRVDAPITGADESDDADPPRGAVVGPPAYAADIPPTTGCGRPDSDNLCATTGQLHLVNRVYRSMQDLGEGYGPLPAGGSEPFPMAGLYQTYRVTVPPGYDPSSPRPLNLVLHEYLGNHNGNASLSKATRLGDDLGAFTVWPLALGPSGEYRNEALVDTLQALADAQRHYAIDRERIGVAGYSMGGGGVYTLTTMLPDLFAAGVIWSGVANASDPLENTHHVPLFSIHGTNDELVPIVQPALHANRLHELGYEYRFDVHPGHDHFALLFLDDWTRERDWLSGRRRAVDPARVVFTVRPGAWATGEHAATVVADLRTVTSALGSAIDGAYWVRDVAVIGDSGTVDLTSAGVHDRTPIRTDVLAAVPGPPSPFVRRGMTLAYAEASPENRLTGTLKGVSELTIDLPRAGLTFGGLVLDISTDQPVTLHLRDGVTTHTMTVQPEAR